MNHNNFKVRGLPSPVVVTDAGTSPGTVGDCDVTVHSSAVVANNYTLDLEFGDTVPDPKATETVNKSVRCNASYAPSVVGRFVDHLGQANRFGIHYFSVTRPDVGTAGCLLDTRPYSEAADVNTYVGHTEGTFASFADDDAWSVHRDVEGWQVTGRLDGNGDPSPTFFLQRFASPPAVSLEAPRVSMIHARYGLCCAHYAPQVGATMTFVGAGEVKVTATVRSVRRSPNYNPTVLSNDWAVVELTEPLPASCGVFSLLPSNWRSHLTSLGTEHSNTFFVDGALPAVAVNRNNEGAVFGVYHFTTSQCRVEQFRTSGTARNDYKAIVTGDSSSPLIMADWIQGSATPYLIGLVNTSATAQSLADGIIDSIEAVINDPTVVLSRGNLTSYPAV